MCTRILYYIIRGETPSRNTLLSSYNLIIINILYIMLHYLLVGRL